LHPSLSLTLPLIGGEALLISIVYITGIILPYARDWYFEMGVFEKKVEHKENFGVIGVSCNDAEEGKEPMAVEKGQELESNNI
jgi:hypothetical protein